jgi:hypothetical protein
MGPSSAGSRVCDGDGAMAPESHYEEAHARILELVAMDAICPLDDADLIYAWLADAEDRDNGSAGSMERTQRLADAARAGRDAARADACGRRASPRRAPRRDDNTWVHRDGAVRGAPAPRHRGGRRGHGPRRDRLPRAHTRDSAVAHPPPAPSSRTPAVSPATSRKASRVSSATPARRPCSSPRWATTSRAAH